MYFIFFFVFSCGHLIEEPFLVPKAPRESFISSSSSASSTGILLQQSKCNYNEFKPIIFLLNFVNIDYVMTI